MLSRPTLIALVVAMIGTLSVAVAAEVRHQRPTAQAAAPMMVIDLPRVVVTGRVAADGDR